MLLPGKHLNPEKKAKSTTPRLNCGTLLDAHNGVYVNGVEDGEEGHKILNGGSTATTGILGGPNQFKSTLADWITFSSLENYYDNSSVMVFDTEDSKEYEQLILRMPYFKRIQEEGVFDNDHIWLSKQSIITGDVYWNDRKEFGRDKRKDTKSLVETPMLNGKEGLIKIIPPTYEQYDSFSRLSFAEIGKKYHETQVDSKDRNMEFVRDGLIKTRVLSEMPTLNAQEGFYTVMTAHLGEDMQLDAGYGSMPRRVLANLEAGQKIKGCPLQFLYMPNNMWFCANQKPHWDKEGVPIYGYGEPGKKHNKDMVVVMVMNLRGKSGSSGAPFPVLMSQSKGVLPNLSMFNYLRSHLSYFGMDSGNNTTMALDFCPDIRMTRNKVWPAIDTDYRLKRALELTVELSQIRAYMTNIGNVVYTPPIEIFTELKNRGYDWDVILGETRGQWQFTSVKSDKKYLSGYDLLRMYQGVWMPSWLGKCS